MVMNLGSMLALSADHHLIRACLIESVNDIYRLVAWWEERPTMNQTAAEQMCQICQQMGDQLGRSLWDTTANKPLVTSENPIEEPPLAQVVAAVTLCSPLRIWIASLSEQYSLDATFRALAGSRTEIVGTTVLHDKMNATVLGQELLSTKPDILLVSGGYDVVLAAKSIERPVVRLCQEIAQAFTHLPREQYPVILYAGYHSAVEAVLGIIKKILTPKYLPPSVLVSNEKNPLQLPEVRIIDNLHPSPNLIRSTQLTEALTGLERQLEQQTPAYHSISRWVTKPATVMSLENAFAQFIQGWMIHQNLPELHGLFCRPMYWMHVWAKQPRDDVRICFTQPKEHPPSLNGWPSVQFVSGTWPKTRWPRPVQSWWDAQGLAPLISTVAQVAPVAMYQVLQADLLS